MEQQKRYRWISEELGSIAIDLNEFGISNLAWQYPTIIEVLKEAYENGKVILGGDIYFLVDGKLETKGDNWYFNKDGLNDSEKSFSKAVEYIEIYMLNNSGCIFSIVVV